MVQQNVAGRPVTVFRFPPRTRLKALSHATVSTKGVGAKGFVTRNCKHQGGGSGGERKGTKTLGRISRIYVIHTVDLFTNFSSFNNLISDLRRCGQRPAWQDTIPRRTSCGKSSTNGALGPSVLASFANLMAK